MKRTKRRYGLYLLLATTLLTLIVAWLLSPLIVRIGLDTALRAAGADGAEIALVAIDPLQGHISLTGLRISRGGRTMLSCEEAEIDIALPALLNQRIDLERLHVSGLHLTIRQEADTPIVIGGLTIPGGAGTTASSAWGIGWHGIAADDIHLRHVHEGESEQLRINSLYLDRATSWQAGVPAHLAIEGDLAGAPFSIHGHWRPFANDPALTVKTQLESFALTKLASMLPERSLALAGRLGIGGELRLARVSDGLVIGYTGQARLSDLSLSDAYYTAHIGKVHANGKLELSLPNNGPLTFGWRADIESHRLEAAERTTPTRLAIAQLELDGLEGDLVDGVSLARAHLGQLVLDLPPRPDATGRLELANLEIEGLKHSTQGRLIMRRVELNQPRLAWHRQAATKQANPTQRPSQSGAPPIVETDTNAAPSWRIGTVHVHAGRMDLVDETVTPPFKGSLQVEELRLGALDTTAPETATAWRLAAGIGDYGRIELTGQVWPFKPRHDFTLSGTVRQLSLPPLAGYGAATIGYLIDQGQLDADLDIGNHGGRLGGTIGLHLRRIALTPADADRIDRLTAQLTMPLPAALAVLSNGDDEIDLSLPLQGDIDAPDFGIGPLIERLLAIAMRKAALSYLSSMLQPYATVFAVAKTALDLAAAIPLDPLAFEPGTSEITTDARPYVERLADLLRQRPALTLRLCGKATARDLARPAPAGRRMTTEDGTPAHDLADEELARLRELARSRADRLKHLLVEQHGIESNRLFVCRPEVEAEADTLPRVDLAL